MRAKINIKDDVTVVSLDGYLDFETPLLFERDCLKRISTRHVVFDFGGLNFIGSSGLTTFLQTIYDYVKTAKGEIRFARVGIEFKRLMVIGEMVPHGFHLTVDSAFESIVHPTPVAHPVTVNEMGYKIAEGWQEDEAIVPTALVPDLEKNQ